MEKKIIAVIPARAGSKGIPNKNIRIVHNRPLVYYAINNAKKSKYITDIIVTTDSVDVSIIAQQMGVTVRHRRPELSSDDVTLDDVIFDATKDIDCDYIITMQPTSPTLSVETLDQAVNYCLTNDLDTLISVINKPHLSWREENGQKKANYTKRLNRQYLPANYIETGAFMISKKSVVTDNNRIGSNIDVYEISDSEAIDIDTFEDLKYVETILDRKKVAIYVNGNNTRGLGHIYRALEIADEFYSKPDIYFDFNQTDPQIFGKTTHNLISVNGIIELFEKVKQEQYDIFINDILTTSIDYMIGLRHLLPKAKIINFEDDGEGIYKADLVINALYEESELSQVKSGEKYFIASKLFMFYEPISIRPKVSNVFISFGGADPQNYTDRLLRIITDDKYKNLKFVVVLGRAKLNIEELMEYNQYPNIEVLYDIKNMPEIMTNCDIGITSRGRTSYELATLGIPSIVMAQNKREEKHGFVTGINGFSYLGLNPSNQIIMANLDMLIALSEHDRKSFQETLLSHDLRNGRSRVMRLIEAL